VSDRAEDTTAAALPPSQRILFLTRTLALAESLLKVAEGTTNQWHAQYCRRAARDFHANVSRILSELPTAMPADTLLPLRGAADSLGERLRAAA